MTSVHRSTGLSIAWGKPLAATGAPVNFGSFDEQLSGYGHNLAADGGLAGLTITLTLPIEQAQEWLLSGLGRNVEVSDDVTDTICEAFVNLITVSVGSLTQSYGPLIDVRNYAYTVYNRIILTSTNPPKQSTRTLTTAAIDADSRSRFGRWEHVLSGGTCLQTEAERQRDSFLSDKAWPVGSTDLSFGGAGEARVTLQCLGYQEWLNAYIYTDATFGVIDLQTKIQNVLAADPNSIFARNYSFVNYNGFLTIREESDDSYAGGIIKSIVSIGDDVTNDRWTFAILPGRIAEYRNVMELDTKYEYMVTDEQQRVTLAATGATVPYWSVRAGEWIFVPDWLAGYTEPANKAERGRDLRYIFAEAVEFGAPNSLSINGIPIQDLPQYLAKLGMGGS